MLIATGILLTVYVYFIFWILSAWDLISKFKGQNETNKCSLYISVLIPVRNDAGKIKSTILSVYSNSFDRESFELIVIDDHSDDGTVECLNELKKEFEEKLSILTQSARQYLIDSYANPVKDIG